jgi:hypothetical protein
VSFAFDLPAGWGPAWSLVADPDNEVHELYEGNNRLDLERVLAARVLAEEVETGLATGRGSPPQESMKQ